MQMDASSILVTLYFLSPLAIFLDRWLRKGKEIRDEELEAKKRLRELTDDVKEKFAALGWDRDSPNYWPGE